MPNCPVCRAVADTHCGLRLYQSQNDCPICLEKNLTMLALPCGHQACMECLKKIGITTRPPTPVRPTLVRPTLVRLTPMHRMSFIQRLFRRRQVRLRERFRRTSSRRCGWCGHLGHTLRNCREHQSQCGCRTRTAAHKRKHARKRRCRSCGKKGHLPSTCNVVIRT